MAKRGKKLTAALVQKFARYGCSVEDIASYFDTDAKTVERNFGKEIEKGKVAMNIAVVHPSRTGHA